MVTQCWRCHCKITQGGIHRSPELGLPIYVLSTAIWFICFPAVKFSVNTNNLQHNRDGGGVSTPQSETIYCTSVFLNHRRYSWFDIFLLEHQNPSLTTKSRIAMKYSVAHQEPSAFSKPWDANDNHYKNYKLCMSESVTVYACVEDNGKVICDMLYKWRHRDWRQKWKMTVVCREDFEIKKGFQVTKYIRSTQWQKRKRDHVKTDPRETGSEGRCWRVGYIH